MDILVCVKQVPDPDARFVPDASRTWYDRTGQAWRMNEYDSYAVEQALLVKEQESEAQVTVLTVGPESAESTLRKALAMGCDQGVHILDPDSWQKEPRAIAALIAAYAKDEHFELIFTGMQSQDRGSGQVGIFLAEMLAITGISTIISFSYRDGLVEVERELDQGRTARVQTPTPALFTCELGLNTPRYPTFPNIAKARRKEIRSIPADALPQTAPALEIRDVFATPPKAGARVLEGDPQALATQLAALLKTTTGVRG